MRGVEKSPNKQIMRFLERTAPADLTNERPESSKPTYSGRKNVVESRRSERLKRTMLLVSHSKKPSDKSVKMIRRSFVDPQKISMMTNSHRTQQQNDGHQKEFLQKGSLRDWLRLL